MRPLSTSAVVLITTMAALMLIAYVFIGGSRGEPDRAPHCTSRQALDDVKREMFRRAAVLRGTNDMAFSVVANYSVVRTGSLLSRRHHSGSDEVICTGVLVMDLPPGVQVIGGRHSIAANVEYELGPSSSSGAKLLMLSKADAIVDLLATVSKAGSQTNELTGALPEATRPPADEHMPAEVAPVSRAVQKAPAPRSARRAQAPPPATIRAEQAKKAAQRRDVSAPPPPKSAPGSKIQPQSSASAPRVVRTGTPSFNCGRARTRGETAVCSNPALATLDRQMSGEFYRALAIARPGQRAMLQRSRNRFLAYRDSCNSDACIASAYRGRMREISDIMSGNW